jgi:serine/threonine-protein kinase
MHRDLKPDNVLIGKNGRVAITDFGIAAPADAGARSPFAGTPAYAAPEQLFGETIGPPVDVFAFGAIFFEMLSGRPAFAGNDLAQLIAARRGAPPDPRQHRVAPDALAELAMRCMAREPAHRFADGASLADALSEMQVSDAPAPPSLGAPIVPGRKSRSIAVLPLRAAHGLEDIASGLGEELVDAFAMTRALRVRPLASVRKVHKDDADPLESGRALGVDVVIDGTLRQNGELLRLAARAIGVGDGFLLWSSRFDARSDALLGVADDLAQKVASALAVDLALPPRMELGAEAAALYLEGKAKLRANWLSGAPDEAVAPLERALALAPGDMSISAALAMALARKSFIGGTSDHMKRARELADRAVAAAPAESETWCALGVTSLYEAHIALAAGAFVRAVIRAPGNALAQAYLGSILLDAGVLDDALAHLEGARALDPENPPLGISDLCRAYMYVGRHADADALLEAAVSTSALAVTMHGRFALWRGQRAKELPQDMSVVPKSFREPIAIQMAYYRTHVLNASQKESLRAAVAATGPRYRAASSQLFSEVMAHAGDNDSALDYIDMSVAAGLQDRQWMQHCPLLLPLRELPRFKALAAVVDARAELALAAVREARTEIAR